MNILAFAASNSKKSINKQLITYASKLVTFADTKIIDIANYEIPIYSPEREEKFLNSGDLPEKAKKFYNEINQADALIISFAEHNGGYTAAYKNLFDWTSRINPKVYQKKPIVMLATSPGKMGASNVLKSAMASAPYFGAEVIGSLSIPNFYKNFDTDMHQFTNQELIIKLTKLLEKLRNL